MTQVFFPLEEALGYLREMIALPSVTGEEGRIGAYLAQKLQAFGADQVQQIGAEDRFSVCAAVSGRTPGPHILLTGHMDTVPAGEGWDSDPFLPLERDGRIYGRGAGDMKAGIAIILAVFHWACGHREELAGKLSVVLVPDEEAFSTGVKQVIGSGFRADFALSAEPSYGCLVTGAVGKVLIRADFQGLRAHGSEPQKGINAVSEAAAFLSQLDRLPLPPPAGGLAAQPYVPLRIAGGDAVYCTDVPDHCTVLMNKHTLPGEDWGCILSQLESLICQSELNGQASFHLEEPFYPPYALAEDHPELLRLKTVYERILGRPVETTWDDGVSDNNCWAGEAGIPTVCLGPSGGGMHAPNEWVSTEEIRQCGQAYLDFLRRI